MKKMAVAALLFLSGCAAYPWEDKIILIRDGQMEISGVSKFGNYCWVSWYHGIEHIILKSDGTADDPPFHYRWEPLDLSERDKPLELFQRNGCHDPKFPRG